MKIGVFDSGLGGLVITKAFLSQMPEYDYFYFGDSAHLPYGDKTPQQVLDYTLDAVRYLIAQDCKLIIIACNTATSISLRYIQQKFIPQYAPDVKVLGVVIPTVEVASENNAHKIAVVATQVTVNSHIYQQELHKLDKSLDILEMATPELVPAIEANDFDKAETIVKNYAQHFQNCDSLILGCTHYPLVKEYFRKELPQVKVVSQDELMVEKLRDYLHRHPEIEKFIGKNHHSNFEVSSLNPHSLAVAQSFLPKITICKSKELCPCI